MNTNPFTEIYRKLSDFEVIRVLEFPADYDPLAVEAAQAEFESRNIDEIEVHSLKKQINEEQIKLLKSRTPDSDFTMEEIASCARSLINITDPTPLRVINFLTLYAFYYYFSYLITFIGTFNLSPTFFFWDYILLLNIGMLIPPIILYLVMQRKKWGWIGWSFGLWLTFFTYALSLIHLLQFWYNNPELFQTTDGSGLNRLLSPSINDLKENLRTDFIELIITLLLLIIFSSHKILQYFSLSKRAVYYTCFSAVITLAIFMLTVFFI